MTNETSTDQVFEWVKEAGAEADIVVHERQATSLKAQDGELDEQAVTSSRSIGIRVVKDDQVGAAFSEASDEASLKFMVEQALTNARFSEAKPEESISTLTGEFKREDSFLDPQDDTTAEEKIDFILQLETKLNQATDIRNVPYNALSDARMTRSVFNSHGRKAVETSRSVSAYAYPLAARGDLTAMAGAASVGRHFSELNLEKLVAECHQRSTALLSGEPIPTKHYDVIFDTSTQAELFQAFSQMWSGKWAQDQINPFRDKLGTTVFDERLTFVDRPHESAGMGFTAFDSEGAETQEIVLVQNGELKTLAHNSATARHFSVENTAHAQRSPTSSLNVGLHQLHVLSGPDDSATLLEGEYLEVTKLDGLHSGTNPISGEFSCGASGYLYRDGERVQTVRGVTVAGNLYDMLKNVVSVSKETYWDESKDSNMPLIRFGQLAVSGS